MAELWHYFQTSSSYLGPRVQKCFKECYLTEMLVNVTRAYKKKKFETFTLYHIALFCKKNCWIFLLIFRISFRQQPFSAQCLNLILKNEL